MANEENLKRGIATQFKSGGEAAEYGRIGGIASGVARRRKKSLKEAADLYLSLKVTDKRELNRLIGKGLKPDDIDQQMEIISGLAFSAKHGNAKAAKLLFDLLGEDSHAADEEVQIIDDL